MDYNYNKLFYLVKEIAWNGANSPFFSNIEIELRKLLSKLTITPDIKSVNDSKPKKKGRPKKKGFSNSW